MLCLLCWENDQRNYSLSITTKTQFEDGVVNEKMSPLIILLSSEINIDIVGVKINKYIYKNIVQLQY